jgi:poly-gamma-glutamate synthesis protein (capsule biosynthesis protein)
LAVLALVSGLTLLASGKLTGGSDPAHSPASTIEGTTASAASVSSLPTVAITDPPVVAVVPVVGFWSDQRSIALSDLARLVAGETIGASGKTKTFRTMAAPSADLVAIADRLGSVPSVSVQRLSVPEIKAEVNASLNTVGLIRADDVTPDVRALGIDGVSLFGSGRLEDLTAWPLSIPTEVPSAFAGSPVWTLDVAGDVNLDRQVFRLAVTKGKGVDYPWDGGTAEMDRLSCCNGFGGAKLAVARTTGNAGAVRKLLSGADVAIVNLEGAVPDDFKSTMTGYSFQFDPQLLAGLTNAGIDAVSLANNHLCNAGTSGVLQTLSNLDNYGIAHAGGGADPAAARQPVMLEPKGVKIAFLAYDAIKPNCWVKETRPGSARLVTANVQDDIKAARAAGADVVLVMPHWGSEYTDYVPGSMRRQAKAMVDAGADLVLGGHSHWVGQIEAISRPQGPAFIDYQMGNFMFDLTHDERTQEGIVCDFTFVGSRLVQLEIHPTIIVDRAQPNLMDPAKTGARVLDIMQRTSNSHLNW